MNDSLFDIPVSKSPRLQWIEDMGILTHRAPHMPEPWIAIQPLIEDNDKDIPTIMSESCRIYDDANLIGYGKSENEAITNLAKNIGLRLWNERRIAMIDPAKLERALECMEIVAQDNISFGLKYDDRWTTSRGKGQLFVIEYLRETFLPIPEPTAKTQEVEVGL